MMYFIRTDNMRMTASCLKKPFRGRVREDVTKRVPRKGAMRSRAQLRVALPVAAPLCRGVFSFCTATERRGYSISCFSAPFRKKCVAYYALSMYRWPNETS